MIKRGKREGRIKDGFGFLMITVRNSGALH